MSRKFKENQLETRCLCLRVHRKWRAILRGRFETYGFTLGPAASKKRSHNTKMADSKDWIKIRAENIMKKSVRTMLELNTAACFVFTMMSRQQRMWMYTQYNLTRDSSMQKIDHQTITNQITVRLAASEFSRWLTKKTDSYFRLEKLVKLRSKNFADEMEIFIRWITDASSSCKNPDERTSVLVKIQ